MSFAPAPTAAKSIVQLAAVSKMLSGTPSAV
jgi:hypothetical protein